MRRSAIQTKTKERAREGAENVSLENVLVSERKQKRSKEKERGLCRPTENFMEVRVKKNKTQKSLFTSLESHMAASNSFQGRDL